MTLIEKLMRDACRFFKGRGILKDIIMHDVLFTVTKYNSEADFNAGNHYEVSDITENVCLNGGITNMLTVIAVGSGTAYSNANAYLGVGDSTAAAAAAQTGLQAATNKKYNSMSATYPQVASQTATWQAVFASGDANYNWNEFITSASSSGGLALNRVVSVQGTKASGQVWTLQLAITWS